MKGFRWVILLRFAAWYEPVSQLHRLMRDYISYYHDDHIHDSLKKDSPGKRAVALKPTSTACSISSPRVGELPHRYDWQQVVLAQQRSFALEQAAQHSRNGRGPVAWGTEARISSVSFSTKRTELLARQLEQKFLVRQGNAGRFGLFLHFHANGNMIAIWKK
jgi:hypothetical protein